jgi:hypothetical protein
MLISNLLDIMLSVLFFSQISGALCAPSIHQHDFLFTTTHCKFLGFLFFIFFARYHFNRALIGTAEIILLDFG